MRIQINAENVKEKMYQKRQVYFVAMEIKRKLQHFVGFA
jgi:hypothetical protein